MPLADVTRKTLIMEVTDWDRFSKNDPLGEVICTPILLYFIMLVQGQSSSEPS